MKPKYIVVKIGAFASPGSPNCYQLYEQHEDGAYYPASCAPNDSVDLKAALDRAAISNSIGAVRSPCTKRRNNHV